jgi:hypothetical protein
VRYQLKVVKHQMKLIDNSEVPAEPASVSEYVNKTEKIIKRTKHILTKKLEDRKINIETSILISYLNLLSLVM